MPKSTPFSALCQWLVDPPLRTLISICSSLGAFMSIVRAIDVGYGITKYIRRVDGDCIECGSFLSMAEFCSSDTTMQGLGGRRDTVAVPMGPHFYEVGPDIELALEPWRSTLKGEDFITTPEYLALMRGALYYMNVEVIDLLVVGLPVAYFADKKDSLVKLAEGEHAVGRGRKVLVKRALAVAQPQGALVTYAAQQGVLDQIQHQDSLIIDVGTRTFDWVSTRGMRLLIRKSHSVDRGINNMLRIIAREISRDIGAIYLHLDAIDLALRKARPLTLYGKPYSIEKFKPLAMTVAHQAVGAMLSQIGDTQRFDNVVLTGGGAQIFKKYIKEALPRHSLLELAEPLYANVRGFQLAGQGRVEAEAGLDAVAQVEQRR
ncbi:PRTRC system protein D [Aquabacterium soli]|nr:PRTRC system protein D [Aquabacterium soli]